MTEPLDLASIKARLAKASPGRWTWLRQSGGISVWTAGKRPATVHGTCVVSDQTDGGVTSAPDAALIANAPTDIAALVADVERLREVVADVYLIAHGEVNGSNYAPGLSEIIDRVNREST